MSVKNTSFCLLAGLVFTACGKQVYEKTQDGVVVKVKQNSSADVSKVRLQALGNKLIRVSATPDKEFDDRQSLIIVPQKNKTPFTVEENDSAVVLATSMVRASVQKNSGKVTFTDLDGNRILAEDQNGGKTFSPIEVEGKKQYTVRQVFDSEPDEAFYGLGQHQADEFNYKGKNEELFQYNTKVSVPVIISNKNYGILWDSY